MLRAQTVIQLYSKRLISNHFESQCVRSDRDDFYRARPIGCGAIPGDEHSLPLLVFLPARQLQQEDVRRVQEARGRRWKARLQVITI